MNQIPAGDEARGAHLLAALQHAPDRDVVPPAALSAAILRRAQAAAQPPRVRWWVALDRLWRPAPMAAFGAVAMATLIGILWSGQDPPEATQAPAAQRAATASARPPGPAVLRPPPREARAQAESAAVDAAAIAPLSPQERAAAKSMADAAPAAPAARTRSAASPPGTLTVELDAAARSDAARVAWRVAAGQSIAHGPPQREWWAALVRATQGAWQRDGARATDSPRVVLLIDGVPRGSLVFEPDHVVWREAGGQAWRAPVAADTLREWREAMARW